MSETSPAWTRIQLLAEMRDVDVSEALPAELQAQLEASGSGMVAQRTEFDENGEPVGAEFELQYEYGHGGSVEGGVGEEDDLELDLETGSGNQTRVNNTFSLDLEDPDTRDAYDQVYNLDTGVMAVPDPTALAEPSRLGDLGEEMATNSSQARWVYDVDSDTTVDGGVSRPGYGVGWGSEDEYVELEEGEFRDNSEPGADWETLDC